MVIRREEEVEADQVVTVNECDKWFFFASTMSKGKKNDHITHHACLKYIIKYYDKKRVDEGLQPILNNIVHTDNCPTQYKCRQNFYKVATFRSAYNHMCRLIHKFAQKYRFKGSWDAIGKIVKERILNHELKNWRCATAWDCYILLKNDLFDKERRDKLFEKLDKYERERDEKILQNTTFTSRNTYVGYVTEDSREFDALQGLPEHEHTVFTERENIEPDMKPLKHTLQVSQVQGDIAPNPVTGKWKITSSFLPCSCLHCRNDPGTCFENCLYKLDRKLVQHDVNMKGEGDNSNSDDLGLHNMTRELLRLELNERGIRTPSSLKKEQLVELLREAIESDLVNDDNTAVEEEVEEESAEVEF